MIELGKVHCSGVCANMLMLEYAKRQYKDNTKIYMSTQRYYSSGHVVVILAKQEMQKLSIYVKKCRPQTKQLVQNVFVSWSGKISSQDQ